jgi:hypothetical protein
MTVGEIRRFAISADAPACFVPPQDAVVRNVAPKQIAPVTEIDRTFIPAATRGDALDRGLNDAIFRKAWVENLDGGIGISLVRLPAPSAVRINATDAATVLTAASMSRLVNCMMSLPR